MRRKEYTSEKYPAVVFEALIRQETGILGIIDQLGFPRPVPLQFVHHEDSIYFHGAEKGEKFQYVRNRMPVSFTLVRELSTIPSNWISADYACPATSLYLSGYGRGTAALVYKVKDRAYYLNLLMEKYQKEGTWRVIDPGDPLYKKALQETAVFCLDSIDWDIKCKIGQNWSPQKLSLIQKMLRERASEKDIETIRWMECLKVG